MKKSSSAAFLLLLLSLKTSQVRKAKKSTVSLTDATTKCSFTALFSKIDLVSTLGFFFPVFFLTSREDRGDNREITKKQIAEFSEGRVKVEGNNKLLMRADSDYRPSDEVKQDMIRTLLMDCEPVLAIDDEPSNCRMLKRHKIPTYQYNIDTDEFRKV